MTFYDADDALDSIGPNDDEMEPYRAHDVEAIPNSGGGFTHWCHACGAMGVGLAPILPCPGPQEER